ncbi:hypothetical protein SASPL_103445 [Salvia splendens]|uniref:Uncharacterized protein n=1 Tax=Salvia splendens TaxID=180675 RepID=A0A8X8YHG6_SALSN|nr:hypothetical protein SASPL_103445 [Salvia splendens]
MLQSCLELCLTLMQEFLNPTPASSAKQREFYKNAKYVKKYKKSINQQEHQSTPSTAQVLSEGENGGGHASQKKMKYKKNARNLQELYEKKHGEQEKDRIGREAMMQAKKEEREAAKLEGEH